MDFNEKVAIITGGAQGIGKAISISFLTHGMKILICDINEHAGKLFIEEVQENLKSRVIYQKCNVSSYEEFKGAFEKAKSAFGRIDIIVNNAGILNENDWKRMIEINFIGVINGIHLAFEFMGINNGGSGGFVINTASNWGLRPFALAPIYSGCKFGIVGLTKSYGQQYHCNKTGVTVNAVCPGPTDTQLFHEFPGGSLDEERAKEHNSRVIPINPEEVAKAVLQLLRDGKNGSLLEVNSEGQKYAE